ncbi:amidase [Bacillus sp. ISL-18]|uniref:amidase n=1 Tax=Bacillus sp. ISL-18 TaxID=2819118 RepID=UPI001BE79FA2|nr:amidase [Bacillus sp. ISL-18]MBT2655659.1 amidase [Bacillus sp. ISL-18]
MNWNSFMNEHLTISPTGAGSLNDLKFAVKDVFEIKNYHSGAGNPDWLQTHHPAKHHAPVIVQLLDQGAHLKGTTHTDELMYSLNGENFHYGTPTNPRARDRIPGGSSSGSAVAVAAGLVDFALGTDTGGSVRIPSSYCGLFGIRPTHGLISTKGVIPLAASFDTVGWMTRNPKLLREVGEILIDQEEDLDDFKSFYFEKEAWSFVEGDTKEFLLKAIKTLEVLDTDCVSVNFSDEGLSTCAQLFRTIQGIEIWREHGAWINTVRPSFGPGVAERFAWASTLTVEELGHLNHKREELKRRLSGLLKTNGLLVIPTAPGEAPLLKLPVEDMEQYRTRAMQLTCIAGLTGFPQVTIPLMKKNGIPIGLSFIANQNQDIKLLKFIQRISSILTKGNVQVIMK